ncbi:unnamed protein product, partial [Protopolystoma xenopodis]
VWWPDETTGACATCARSDGNPRSDDVWPEARLRYAYRNGQQVLVQPQTSQEPVNPQPCYQLGAFADADSPSWPRPSLMPQPGVGETTLHAPSNHSMGLVVAQSQMTGSASSHPASAAAMLIQTSRQMETELQTIRGVLRSIVDRLADKDIVNKRAREWRMLALVLDRIFFWLYLTIHICAALGLLVPGSWHPTPDEGVARYGRQAYGQASTTGLGGNELNRSLLEVGMSGANASLLLTGRLDHIPAEPDTADEPVDVELPGTNPPSASTLTGVLPSPSSSSSSLSSSFSSSQVRVADETIRSGRTGPQSPEAGGQMGQLRAEVYLDSGGQDGLPSWRKAYPEEITARSRGGFDNIFPNDNRNRRIRAPSLPPLDD